MNKIFMGVCLLFCLSAKVSAQAVVDFKVANFYNGNFIKPITEGNDVKGYIVAYKIDKADRKNDNYGLDIYDTNLNQLKHVAVVMPRGLIFLGSNFNGEALSLFLFNLSKSTYLIKSFDKELKELGSTTVTKLSRAEKLALTMSIQAGNTEPLYTAHLAPIPGGKSFVRLGTIGDNARGYSLTCYNNDMTQKWTFESNKEKKGFEGFWISDISDKYIIGICMHRDGLLSTKFTYTIAVFNAETGEQLMNTNPEKSNEQLSINAIQYNADKNNLLVEGDFYKMEDKPGVNKSQGFYMKTLSMSGEETSMKKYAWATDVKNLMPAEAKESLEKGYQNFTHKVVYTADGRTFMVWEQYKRVADGFGIASAALGGKSNVMKGLLGGISVVEISADSKIKDIKYYPKEKMSVILPYGMDFMGIGMVGLVMKAYDQFRVAFVQTSNDHKTFDALYLDFDKEKEEKSKPIAGSVFLSPEGTINTDKIDFDSKASYYQIYRAPKGSVGLLEHWKKGNKTTFRLVKMNY